MQENHDSAYGGDQGAKNSKKLQWCSPTMEATNTWVRGYLRKTVKQVKVFQQTQYPQRYYYCDRLRKTLIIFDEPDGKIKEVIHVSKMKHVEYPDRSEFHETKHHSILEIAQALQTPKDFPYPIIIYMQDRIMLLWAKSNIERSFWVDTIQEMITESYPNRKENIQEHIETLLMVDKSFNAELANKLKMHF